jgi:cytochrome b pre-mRNA-processing protein 3
MLKALKHIFAADSGRSDAHSAYLRIVAQARKPQFYREFAVPDTLDVRFDVIVAHLFLAINRLRGEDSLPAAEFIRSLSEAFFADMDRSLREMGVGDTGVGHRIKKMAQAFYGRLQAYEQNIERPEAFEDSLRRNLYRSQDISSHKLRAACAYMQRNLRHLRQQDANAILSGNITFLD